MSSRGTTNDILLGIGSYTVPEAARLLRIPSINIRRWLGGYSYKTQEGDRRLPPLWTPQIPTFEAHIELGFRDLIELRFVSAFLHAGLGLQTIRGCLEYARTLVDDERPFSTRQFHTDGKTIFFQFIDEVVSAKDGCGVVPPDELQGLLDLKKRQFAFREIIIQTFKDLDIDDTVVYRWRPFHGKDTIVVDPQRAFGQPIATNSGVPTTSLAEAVKSEGTAQRVAFLYDVPIGIVRDAVKFESELAVA